MIDTKEFMQKAKAAKTFEIHPVWLKHIQNLCDSHDKLERKLRFAETGIVLIRSNTKQYAQQILERIRGEEC